MILEQEGYIYTERTNGKFVADNFNLFKLEKEIIFKEKIDHLIDDIQKLGYTKEEVIKKIMEEIK
jgi:DNA-binding transcriptional regulator YhcF (GntR family)